MSRGKLVVESIDVKDMNVLTLKNESGFTVANLYILHNGNLHPDSWLCNEGWGNKFKED